jgi:hypothetical protein
MPVWHNGIVAIAIATMIKASEAAKTIRSAVELDKIQKKEDELEEERRRRNSSTLGLLRRNSSTLGLLRRSSSTLGLLLHLEQHHGDTFCKKGAIFPTDS